MQAPLIDKRSYADLVTETGKLASESSGWQPRPDGMPDAGQALIGIFGRFAELVIERLNRAPDKNYLAFLNLIGASPVPPRPARVPLTFHLATDSPVDAAVPAGTMAAAPPLAGEQEDVVFETERNLVVTRAQLLAAYVSDTKNDTYSDRSAQATGRADEPFAVFTGDQRSPHQLYLACDPLLTEPGRGDVTLTLLSPHTSQWQNWPIVWAYWDGATWQTITGASTAVQEEAWRVMLPALPALTLSAVNRINAGWLRAQLDMPLPRGQVPESIAVGARNPQDPTFPLSPFPADSPVQRFYLSADDAFAAGGARVTLRVRLSQPGAGAGVQLSWRYHANGQWLDLGQSSTSAEQTGPTRFDFRDGTKAFTQDGEISFYVPMSWPSSTHYNSLGRWLRVEGTGQYTTLPKFARLTVGWLPRLGGITVTAEPGPAPSPVPPAHAFFNAIGIDLSKDFYPLGQQPQFNDTFYVACPDALAGPGTEITLNVTLTNPPPRTDPPQGTDSPVPLVRPDDNPKIAWEVSDGSQWHATSTTPANYAFTKSDEVKIRLPDPIGQTSVNGEQGYWLRARLVGGNYGTAASYTQTDHTYTYKAADFAPPVVKTLTITATAAPQPPAPVMACLSYNDFGYVDHTAAARAGSGPSFTPFTPTADTEPALYLGFDQPFSQRAVTLFLEVEPPRPEQVAAGKLAGVDPAATAVQTTWEYGSLDGWRPLGAVDETRGLSSRGLVSFIGPADIAPRSCFGQTLSWLRLRWQAGTFPLPPRLRRVLLNTTWASQVTTVENEILGPSNGDPGQAFTAARAPVQPGQEVTVREPQLPVPAEEQALAEVEGADAVTQVLNAAGLPDEVWVRWQAVPDFYQSGPRDRHYTVDPLSGVISFGDGETGMIPPIGQSNIRMTYASGGGKQGNRASATIVELKSSIPYIDGVTNNQPAEGGAPVEPIDRVKARGPRVLRHRDRAVAAQDLEDLAVAASADVATAAAIVPIFNPYSLWRDPTSPVASADYALVGAGGMGVIIVPNEPESPRPTPSLVLLSQVQTYLRERCPPTADLWVAGPEWIAVNVEATVVVTSVEDADPAGDAARSALQRYLHPLTGGSDGQGWSLGRWPHASDLSALLEAIRGVDHVGSLTVSFEPQTVDEARKRAVQKILNRKLTQPSDQVEQERVPQSWLDRALVYSGPNVITVALGEQVTRPDEHTVRRADADSAP